MHYIQTSYILAQNKKGKLQKNPFLHLNPKHSALFKGNALITVINSSTTMRTQTSRQKVTTALDGNGKGIGLNIRKILYCFQYQAFRPNLCAIASLTETRGENCMASFFGVKWTSFLRMSWRGRLAKSRPVGHESPLLVPPGSGPPVQEQPTSV